MGRGGRSSKRKRERKNNVISLQDGLGGNIEPHLVESVGEEEYLSFSFRYCGQQKYFGYKDQDAVWFANLQDRLKDLSGKTSAIFEDPTSRRAYRIHPIDWDKSPIRPEDIKSLPKTILDNKKELLLWQFQISKGTGRVIGFLDDRSVFHIVLLDPKHNVQPSRKNDYGITETRMAFTDYEKLQFSLIEKERKRKKCPHFAECAIDLNVHTLSNGCFYSVVDIELKDVFLELERSGLLQSKFEEFLLSQL